MPAICLADMSEEDVHAYVIADNKLAENAGWDTGLLAVEFQYLNYLEFGFDLSLTGFELPEIGVVLQDFAFIGDGSAEVSVLVKPVFQSISDCHVSTHLP